jgi:hypothetical protein
MENINSIYSVGLCANITVVFQFNMGKKFGGYSWLRSADSTRRRLEYFLANKWQRDGDSLAQVSRETLSNGATATQNFNYVSFSRSAGRLWLQLVRTIAYVCG